MRRRLVRSRSRDARCTGDGSARVAHRQHGRIFHSKKLVDPRLARCIARALIGGGLAGKRRYARYRSVQEEEKGCQQQVHRESLLGCGEGGGQGDWTSGEPVVFDLRR